VKNVFTASSVRSSLPTTTSGVPDRRLQ
jgi:hypothetical protein